MDIKVVGECYKNMDEYAQMLINLLYEPQPLLKGDACVGKTQLCQILNDIQP